MFLITLCHFSQKRDWPYFAIFRDGASVPYFVIFRENQKFFFSYELVYLY